MSTTLTTIREHIQELEDRRAQLRRPSRYNEYTTEYREGRADGISEALEHLRRIERLLMPCNKCGAHGGYMVCIKCGQGLPF